MSVTEDDEKLAKVCVEPGLAGAWKMGNILHDKNGRGRSARAMIPGCAGELVQGQLKNGEDFLVTNPIECFSKVKVVVCAGTGSIAVFPPERLKVKKAIAAFLVSFDILSVDVCAYIDSSIPPGKGMASSTADIVAAVEALAAALDIRITPEQVSVIALSIEPSDGLMYRGVVIYNHRQGRLHESLGPGPLMRQLIIDTGGSIDTIAFNKIPKAYTEEEIVIQAQALDLVRQGIKTADLAKIGQGTTLSALVNQRLLPKCELQAIINIAHKYGAYGVICAHSGTILSLLFDPEDLQDVEKADQFLQSTYRVHLRTLSIGHW